MWSPALGCFGEGDWSFLRRGGSSFPGEGTSCASLTSNPDLLPKAKAHSCLGEGQKAVGPALAWGLTTQRPLLQLKGWRELNINPLGKWPQLNKHLLSHVNRSRLDGQAGR